MLTQAHTNKRDGIRREAAPEAARLREGPWLGCQAVRNQGGMQTDSDLVIATSHSRREAIATSTFPLRVE